MDKDKIIEELIKENEFLRSLVEVANEAAQKENEATAMLLKYLKEKSSQRELVNSNASSTS